MEEEADMKDWKEKLPLKDSLERRWTGFSRMYNRFKHRLYYKDNMSSKWLDNNLINIAKADVYLKQHLVLKNGHSTVGNYVWVEFFKYFM